MLEDPDTAPISPGLRATLALLRKVTLTPDEVGEGDVNRARAEGVGDEALRDALQVCFAFNLIDRLADAFGWHVQTEDEFGMDAVQLLKRGYRMIGPVRKRALAAR